MERIIQVQPKTPGIYPRWECFNCGECCKDLSLSHLEYKLIREKLNPKAREKFVAKVFHHPENDRYYYVKGKCLFRNEKTQKCMIYSLRPFSCRMFMCGRKNVSEPLMYLKTKCLNSKLRMKIDPYFREQEIHNRIEALKWGNKYGWKKGDFI